MSSGLEQIGRGAPIKAPPRAELVDVRRQRLEIERQMVVGERPLDPAWRALSPNGDPPRKRRAGVKSAPKRKNPPPQKARPREAKAPALKKPAEKRDR